VALASDGDPVTGHGELGRITALSEDEVVVETDEPVELRRLDVYPSGSPSTARSPRSTTRS